MSLAGFGKPLRAAPISRLHAPRTRTALAIAAVVLLCAIWPAPAAAFNPLKPICSVAGIASGLLGKACTVFQNGGQALSAGEKLLSLGRKLLGGRAGSVIKNVAGKAIGAARSGATTALGLAALGTWVIGGAKFALRAMAKVLSQTTTPRLGSTWFSATYWRVAAIAALLTLPFLFAAAVQALLHSDLTLLIRAALGYLPLAILAVSIAAPVTMLLLSGSDELSGLVSSAAGVPGAHFLDLSSAFGGALAIFTGSPFLIFFIGLLTVAGAVALWIELLMREAAVYVVVLMLPLAFAALVWPARRTWAIRAVELLVALILSKFAIVAVLALGGAAMDHAFGHGIAVPVVGVVLVLMGAFAPWVLLRLVPLGELAGAAVGSLWGEVRAAAGRAERPFAIGVTADEWAAETTAEMSRAAGNIEARLPKESREESIPTANESQNENGTSEAPWPDHGVATGPPALTSDEGPASSPETAAGASEGAASPSAAGESRLPGLPKMWQAADLTWRPLGLGTNDGWPPPPVCPVNDLAEKTEAETAPFGEDVNPLPPPPEEAPKAPSRNTSLPAPSPPQSEPVSEPLPATPDVDPLAPSAPD